MKLVMELKIFAVNDLFTLHNAEKSFKQSF